jgi:hypothetical protein
VRERRQWQTTIDAGEFMAKHGMKRGETELIAAAFVEGREAVDKMLREMSLTPAGRSTAIVLLTIFGFDDLIDKALEGFDPNRTPFEDGELLVAAGLAADRPEFTRDVILTNLNRLRRELEPLAGFDRSKAYLRPTALYKQIVAAWPALNPQDRSSAVSLYGMCLEETDGMSELLASYHFLLCLTDRADEVPIKHLRKYLDRSGLYFRGHLATIIDRWLANQPQPERPAAVRNLLDSKTGAARASALSRLGGYLGPANLTEELLHEFPELAGSPQVPVAPTEADLIRERQRFAREIASRLQTMGSDAGMIFVLNDITLRPAANMLPPEQLDMLIQDYGKSRDAFELLTKFLLLKNAGRDTEAMPLLEDIFALPPDDPKVEAAKAALPQLLTASGWNMPALRMMRKNHSASVRNLHLDFELHDPLSILADNSGGTLDAGIRRVHASRLMASPEQFKQAVRIYHSDTRHPDLTGDYHKQVQASMWPPRIPASRGGLLDKGPQPSGSFLADLAVLDGGQQALMHWLRSVTPTWLTNETEICKQIANNAAEHGLVAGNWQVAAGSGGALGAEPLRHQADRSTRTAVPRRIAGRDRHSVGKARAARLARQLRR